jgi:hypothetical protein
MIGHLGRDVSLEDRATRAGYLQAASRVSILVSPRLGHVDETHVVATALDVLAFSSSANRMMARTGAMRRPCRSCGASRI